MFAWSGNQQQPGGLYRVRYTGRPAIVPIELNAEPGRLRIRFSDPIDPESGADANGYLVQTWSLRRSANYGSDHLNERELKVASARLSSDHRTVWLEIPDMEPTWCMEIRIAVRAADGQMIERVIHNTIHRLAPPESGQ